MMTEDLFDDYGHIDFDDDGDDGFLDMDALAAAEQLSIGARALADDGSILDLTALSADSYASDAGPGISLNGSGGSSSNGSGGSGDGAGDSKESTGRWTRDEHLLFIKGLEMYGKGWKKIAGLIKTRTVVQIRTHAQKYFLKLAKARQNGGGDMHSGSLSLDGKSFPHGIRKKKLRRRRHDKPIAVAPPLQPFIKIRKEGAEAPEPIDVDTGLYQFLSAPMGTISTTPSTLQLPTIDEAEAAAADGSAPKASPTGAAGAGEAGEGAAAAAAGPVAGANMGVRSCGSLTSFSGVAMVERLRLNSGERSLPEWYAKGEHVSSLLKEAEALDWGVELMNKATKPLEPAARSTTTSAATATAAAASTTATEGALVIKAEEGAAAAAPVKAEDSSPQTVAVSFSEEEPEEKPAPDSESATAADSNMKLELAEQEAPAADCEARRVGSKASFAAMSQDNEGSPTGGGGVGGDAGAIRVESAPSPTSSASVDATTTEPTISGPSSPMPAALKVADGAGYTVKKVATEATDASAAAASTPTAAGSKVTALVASSSPNCNEKSGSDSESDALGGIVF